MAPAHPPFAASLCIFSVPNKRLNFSSIVNCFSFSLAFSWASAHDINFISLSESSPDFLVTKKTTRPTMTANTKTLTIDIMIISFFFDLFPSGFAKGSTGSPSNIFLLEF